MFPMASSRAGNVDVSPGEIIVSSPLLSSPLHIPTNRVWGVVRQTEITTDPTIYVRNVRTLGLGVGRGDANVQFVLTEPLFVDGFTRGAERVLRINTRERKNGVPIDVVEVAVEQPDLLVAAVARQGVRLMSRAEALASTVGVANGPERDQRIRAMRSLRRRVLLGLTILSLFSSELLVARVDLESWDGSDKIHWTNFPARVIATLVVFALAAMVVAAVTQPPASPRPVRPRSGKALRLSGLVGALAVGFGLVWLHRGPHISDGWLVPLDALICGGWTGGFTGYLWARWPPAGQGQA